MRTPFDPSRLDHLLKHIIWNRFTARVLIIAMSIGATLFGLLAPIFQKDFLDHLSGLPSEVSLPFFENMSSPLLIIGSFICLLLAQLCVQITNYLGLKEALIFQKEMGELMYRRTLQLRADTLAGKSVGELVALFATDIQGASILLEQSLPTGFMIVMPLILTPTLLITFLHIPATPTLILIGFLVVINALMAYRQSGFFFLFKQLAAERIGTVNEWIQNIRALRILGWTEFFEFKIKQRREAETLNRVRMVTNGQAMNAIASTVTFFINIIAMTSLLWFSDVTLTPGKVLAVFWIVGVFLVRPFRMMPWFFTFVMDGLTSLKRLQMFFALHDQNGQHLILDRTLDRNHLESHPDLKVVDLNLKIDEQNILNNLSFEVKAGEFLAVVGPVGAGKTSLLLSFLGENGATFKSLSVGSVDFTPLVAKERKPAFSFVTQDGFIMSARLRDNVVMSYQAPHQIDASVKKSLRLAQFDIDEEDVPLGLETEIGERGVNLSGGQKQRVNLARAHYFSRPIVLLDDCLSAVDVETEKLLIEKLINGEWKKHTRILVTHRLSVLEQVDRILFIEEGEIKAIGQYQNLLRTCNDFKEFITLSTQESPHRTEPSL